MPAYYACAFNRQGLLDSSPKKFLKKIISGFVEMGAYKEKTPVGFWNLRVPPASPETKKRGSVTRTVHFNHVKTRIMANTNANTQTQALVSKMSKFQTVNAAREWWSTLSPQQKGAIVGSITAVGMGGYIVYATYGTVSLATSIWGGILYGSAAGCFTTAIATAAFTPKDYYTVTNNLGNDL